MTTFAKNAHQPATHDSAPAPSTQTSRPKVDPKYIQTFVENLFGDDLHAMRVLSLANGVVGVLHAAVLAIHAIGQAYAKVANVKPKSGVKQVDRLLSNTGIDVFHSLKSWVEFVIGVRKEIVIALDWTDFEKDDHTTLCAYLVTRHGRATPLAWKTVKKSALKGTQKDHEYELIEWLHGAIDETVEVILLADRGFGDRKLYDFLEFMGWDFVIRFRGGIVVENAAGEARSASAWVPTSRRATMLREVRVTADRAKVPAVVLVHAPKMKEPWCLATTLSGRKAGDIVKLYGKRFTIEETFRDIKDNHFGMGLSATHIHNADRRDRLLLLAAIAHALLTLLGAASEEAGLDRYLKVNTVKRRTHSLYRQGLYWYDCIPTLREDWLRPLMTAFDRIVREHAVFREIFGII
ncbi:IS4 family transposase [Sorangium sp. So ce362]|uniref:IS4 family transposase n=1 Tax=Sorangium sp. So ce362 TaxID=3133303 RepID=UPI003F6034B7